MARLAKALGVEGAPVAQGEAWKVGAGQDGSGPSLQVNRQAPGAWTFSRYAPGTDNWKGTDTCTAPQPGGNPVSEAEAEKAAAPVLKALGQDDNVKFDASQVMGAQRVVNAAPEVGGLPTHGWTTRSRSAPTARSSAAAVS
ncbi:Large membrane protein OS=Streptomyces violarus OX=67380 GN=FHS41_005751 PE=4 SV=1 [Streptomyces violarus]